MKNTACPGCSKTLRVSARVVSDGNEYVFYLCPQCEDVVLQDPGDGSWQLRGESCSSVTDVISMLQSLAIETWRKRSTSSALLAASSAPGPAKRALYTPGAPSSASTSMPESSASAGRPVCVAA